MTRMTKSQLFDSAETTSELPSTPKSPKVAVGQIDVAAQVGEGSGLNVIHVRRVGHVVGQIVVDRRR